MLTKVEHSKVTVDPNSTYESEGYQMFSGRDEAESRRYHLVVGKDGRRWLHADQEDSASNIYVEGGPNSDGFGGSTLAFVLIDGTELKLKGPWHTNSESLFKYTNE